MRDGDNSGFYEPLKKNKYRLFNPKQKSESSVKVGKFKR
jgi:hypothetical protein